MNICGLFNICLTHGLACLQYARCVMNNAEQNPQIFTHTQPHTHSAENSAAIFNSLSSTRVYVWGEVDLNIPCVNYYSIAIARLCLWYFHLHFNIRIHPSFIYKNIINYYVQFCFVEFISWNSITHQKFVWFKWRKYSLKFPFAV